MMDTFLLYLFTRLDVLTGTAIAMAIFSAVALVPLIITYLTGGRDNNVIHFHRLIVKLFVVSLSITIFLPNQRDMAIIVGGKFAIEAAKSETAKQLSSEVLTAIRAKLREATK